MTTPLLVAEDVGVTFGGTDVLVGASLSLAVGEIVGVVGPSGSGKSTLLRVLCGLIEPGRGQVRLDGAPISGRRTSERDRIRRTQFGFVFQAGELVPELSLLENVSLPRRLAGERAGPASKRALAGLDAVGIGALASRLPWQVSGGELQRAAIARALIHEPRIVLADEPTGALDDSNAASVYDLFLEHAKRHDAAVIVVTHDRSLAARTDRVAAIDAGRLLPA